MVIWHVSTSLFLRQVQKMRVPVVSKWGSWRIKQSKTFRHFCEIAKEVLSYLVPWKKGIQKIGGNKKYNSFSIHEKCHHLFWPGHLKKDEHESMNLVRTSKFRLLNNVHDYNRVSWLFFVGHFGGGVQSYFLFLRFLVILNLLSFLLIAAFVLIPSIVFHSVGFNSSIPLSVNLTSKQRTHSVCLVLKST